MAIDLQCVTLLKRDMHIYIYIYMYNGALSKSMVDWRQHKKVSNRAAAFGGQPQAKKRTKGPGKVGMLTQD